MSYSHFLSFMKPVSGIRMRSAASKPSAPSSVRTLQQNGKPFKRKGGIPLLSPQQKGSDIHSHFFQGWNLFLASQCSSIFVRFDPCWLFALLCSSLLRNWSPARSGDEQKMEFSLSTGSERAQSVQHCHSITQPQRALCELCA